MSFTSQQVAYLQRLVKERPETRQSSAAAQFFFEHYSLGQAIGRRVEYRPNDFTAAANLLRTNDLPIEALGEGATRSDSAAFGGMSEKAFSAAPHAQSVAVKCIGRCELDGQVLATPAGSYLVLTPDRAVKVTCQRLMLVENLETFRTLESYAWIDWRGMNVLAVYRGDPELPNKDAAEVIRARPEPIWGFFDFDPAGLTMANTLPEGRLERVVLPSTDWLRQASNAQRGRQLFDTQVGKFGRALDTTSNDLVRGPWDLMKGLRSAVTQEKMLSANE